MEKGVRPAELLDKLTRPQLMLYGHLKEKKQYKEARKRIMEGGGKR